MVSFMRGKDVLHKVHQNHYNLIYTAEEIMVSQQDNTNLKGNNLVFEFLTSFKHMPGFWRENEYSLTIYMHLCTIQTEKKT